MGDGLLHAVYTPEDKPQIEMLQEELLAILQDKRDRELKVAEKSEIKKLIGGRSPNIADALVMGVWYLQTQSVTQDQARENSRYTNMGGQNNIQITGAPSL